MRPHRLRVGPSRSMTGDLKRRRETQRQDQHVRWRLRLACVTAANQRTPRIASCPQEQEDSCGTESPQSLPQEPVLLRSGFWTLSLQNHGRRFCWTPHGWYFDTAAFGSECPVSLCFFVLFHFLCFLQVLSLCALSWL